LHSFVHGSTAALQPGVDSHTSAPQHCNPAMIQTPQHDNAALLGCSVAVSVKTRCSHVVSGCQHSLLGCRVSERCSAAGSAFALIYRQRFPKIRDGALRAGKTPWELHPAKLDCPFKEKDSKIVVLFLENWNLHQGVRLVHPCRGSFSVPRSPRPRLLHALQDLGQVVDAGHLATIVCTEIYIFFEVR